MNPNGIVLTNYISRNPAIRFFLQRFMGRIARILEDIRAMEGFGLYGGCGEGHLLSYLYR